MLRRRFGTEQSAGVTRRVVWRTDGYDLVIHELEHVAGTADEVEGQGRIALWDMHALIDQRRCFHRGVAC